MMLTLKAARANAGLTQMQAAEKIGVTHCTISSWETGKNFPSKKNIIALAKVYGVDVNDLKLFG